MSLDKYNRNYLLKIQTDDLTFIQIQRPFTIEFDIIRNSLASANTSNFRVYNLAENTRSKIRRNQYDFGSADPSTQRLILFNAGYGSNLSLGFGGYVYNAYSVREGTDF